VKEKFKDRIKEIDQNVKQLEQEHCFNELDFATTKSEIAKAIAQVKANKSPGVDCISNSMIKKNLHHQFCHVFQSFSMPVLIMAFIMKNGLKGILCPCTREMIFMTLVIIEVLQLLVLLENSLIES
jgi:hypothetical protein